jgi:hypothetical protein
MKRSNSSQRAGLEDHYYVRYRVMSHVATQSEVLLRRAEQMKERSRR